ARAPGRVRRAEAGVGAVSRQRALVVVPAGVADLRLAANPCRAGASVAGAGGVIAADQRVGAVLRRIGAEAARWHVRVVLLAGAQHGVAVERGLAVAKGGAGLVEPGRRGAEAVLAG